MDIEKWISIIHCIVYLMGMCMQIWTSNEWICQEGHFFIDGLWES